jgi:hypothetical protein
MTEKGDLSTQPGQKEKMKIFSTHGFGQGFFHLDRTPTTTAVKEGRSTFG